MPRPDAIPPNRAEERLRRAAERRHRLEVERETRLGEADRVRRDRLARAEQSRRDILAQAERTRRAAHPPRSRAGQAVRLLGVAALAMLAASSRPRGPKFDPPPSRRPNRPPPRPGGHPLPQPVHPDRPNLLSGGAAAELSFDD